MERGNMSKPYKEFEPAWVKEPAPKDSYRSVFRWGDPDFVKYPKESLYKMMKEKFGMTDEDFKAYDGDIGMDRVELNAPCRLAPEHIRALRTLLGRFCHHGRLPPPGGGLRENRI